MSSADATALWLQEGAKFATYNGHTVPIIGWHRAGKDSASPGEVMLQLRWDLDGHAHRPWVWASEIG